MQGTPLNENTQRTNYSNQTSQSRWPHRQILVTISFCHFRSFSLPKNLLILGYWEGTICWAQMVKTCFLPLLHILHWQLIRLYPIGWPLSSMYQPLRKASELINSLQQFIGHLQSVQLMLRSLEQGFSLSTDGMWLGCPVPYCLFSSIPGL